MGATKKKHEQFIAAISEVNRCIQKIERNEMIKYGYKGAYALYLMTMLRHPEGVTSAQLCELCDRDKAAVSRSISEMRDNGLVCSENGNDSRYRARLVLTEEGKRIADCLSERAMFVALLVSEQIDDEQCEAFYTTIDMFSERLQNIAQNGIPESE